MNFLTLNPFNKRIYVLIFFLLLNFFFPNEIPASKKRSIISGVEVKVHKRERKHIEASALLCALARNGYYVEDLKKNLKTNFKNPISKSDQFLLLDLMSSMCPEVNNRKIFENK